MPRTKNTKQVKKEATKPKQVIELKQPDGCINCNCFTRETDSSILKRGYTGQCHAETTIKRIDRSTVEEKRISNTCIIYTVEEKRAPSCRRCNHFKPERDLVKIRRNTGGMCKHKKGNFTVQTHVSNNDEYPDNCPIHGV